MDPRFQRLARLARERSRSRELQKIDEVPAWYRPEKTLF